MKNDQPMHEDPRVPPLFSLTKIKGGKVHKLTEFSIAVAWGVVYISECCISTRFHFIADFIDFTLVFRRFLREKTPTSKINYISKQVRNSCLGCIEDPPKSATANRLKILPTPFGGTF